MRKIVPGSLAFAAAVLCSTAAYAQAPPPGRPRSSVPRASAPSPDAATPDAIVKSLYEAVSHGPDSQPDWKRMRDIFLPVGMLVPPKRPQEDIFTVLDVDAYEERTKKWMAEAKAKGESTAFFETEVARRTDCFGHV